MSFSANYISSSEDETHQIGYNFAGNLNPDSIVSLTGELGAGKTVFIKGICSRLCPDILVSSPSFTIINSYPANNNVINHVDLYRINDEDEIYDVGIIELFDCGDISLIEWGEKISKLLPRETFIVSMKIISNEEREIVIKQ
ncbi:MAG: tRNA (adenosine(37)-N6)-threonylcarbamoyltransferase complex ATPase subunit type 1 TsaE [candidate division Zixibacteria bacterium]|nr:tRNA (adenosine(37)-N6)-threonylcarbamoyltransferase complex ATPase subunit type 1 TsaE [candidate division Zixibacteria bacterium]